MTLHAAVAALALLVSCAGGLATPPVQLVSKPGTQNVVIVRSSKHAIFDGPILALTQRLEQNIWVVSLEGSGDAEAAAAVRALSPRIVVTLGQGATLMARDHLQDVPVVFGMVVNYRRLGLERLSNFTGIALESSPITEFVQFKLVVPTLTRVLTFYEPTESRSLIKAARDELNLIGVELTAIPVKSSEEVAAAYDKHRGAADAVWLLNDPVVLEPRTFSLLRERTGADRKPFMASLSEDFVKRGALMAVSVDFSSIGAQAALVIRSVLAGKQPGDIPVQPPLSTRLAVNVGIAAKLGLNIAAEVKPMIVEIKGE